MAVLPADGINRRRGVSACRVALATVGAIIVAGVPAACDRSATQPKDPMTIEEIIRQNADRPLGESIAVIASALAKHRIILATDDTTVKPTQPSMAKIRPTTQAGSFAELVNSLKQPGITIEFKSGKDAQRRVWAHAYTSPEEFERAFPQGQPSTELSFRHFFGMIEGDAGFAGIRLNPGSDASYVIPRELFEKVKELLPRKRPADG